jgi:hypothetical protein
MTNTLAYHNTECIRAVKMFVGQARPRNGMDLKNKIKNVEGQK